MACRLEDVTVFESERKEEREMVSKNSQRWPVG